MCVYTDTYTDTYMYRYTYAFAYAHIVCLVVCEEFDYLKRNKNITLMKFATTFSTCNLIKI